MKIAITGHRPNKLDNDYNLTSPLIQRIKERIIHEVIMYKDLDLTLITGMALGIDTLFAQIAIEYHLPFIAAIPCLQHDSKWIDKSRKIYHDILSNPLCTIKLVSNTTYNSKVMQDRNIWMVDNCDLLIAIWDGTSGGTHNCVQYATGKHKTIIRINPNDYRLIPYETKS